MAASGERRDRIALFVLLLLAGAVFANALGGVFVFDDYGDITGNPSAHAATYFERLAVMNRPLTKASYALQDALRRDGLQLPDRYNVPLPDTYARRLLHRDPEGRYTAVVMTWGPGQKTALHDHAGIWCVECVVDGRMEVTQYDLVSESGDSYRFVQQNCITAERGSAGCLIPPFEYHTLANARPDAASRRARPRGPPASGRPASDATTCG